MCACRDRRPRRSIKNSENKHMEANFSKAPSGRELTQKAVEGLFYRKSNLYNPSVTLRVPPSLTQGRADYNNKCNT